MRTGRLASLGLVLALVFAWAAQARAGQFLVRNWSSQQGLPHSRVTAIVQARDGYLWLGTDVGLVRFDGARFVSFSSAALSASQAGAVSTLFEDREGTLWVALENGHLVCVKSGVLKAPQFDVGFNRPIVAMAQDAEKTVWAQTSDGRLGRLEAAGVTLSAESGAGSRSPSIGLVVDDRNTLWVGTSDGLKILKDGALATPPGLEAQQGHRAEALARAADGGVWCFQDRQLRKLTGGRTVRQVEAPGDLEGGAAQLLETSRGELWLAAVDGSLFHLSATGIWETIPAQDGLEGANPVLCEDAEGNLWRGSAGGGLTQIRPKVLTAFELPTGAGYSLILSFDGSTSWSNGLGTLVLDNVVLRTTNPMGTNYAQDFNSPGATPQSVHWDGGFAYSGAHSERHQLTNAGVGHSGALVTSVQVTEGHKLGAFTEYWSGTLKLPPGANPRNVALTAEVAGNQPGAAFSFKLNDHAGHYIVFNGTVAGPGTFQSIGGLLSTANLVDPAFDFGRKSLDHYPLSVCSGPGGDVWLQANSHTLAHLPAGASAPRPWPGATMPQRVRTLLCDRSNSLWAGTDGGYLYRLTEGTFVPVLRVGENAAFISALFEDAQSNLWVGFTPGPGVGVLPAGDPRRWRVVPGLPVPDVRAIAQAADGAMWFGTCYGGASRLQEGRWTHFTSLDGLGPEYVRCIRSEPDGTLWLGTLRGLFRWRQGKFSSIRAQDGLWHEALSDIEEDGRGNLWISSLGGIFQVAKRELNDFAEGRSNSVSCIGYGPSDGLPGPECAGGFQPAGTRTPDGCLWFPSGGGLVRIDPERVALNTRPAPVRVEEVRVEDVPLPPSAGPAQIGPGQHRLEFRFTALSLTVPENVRFRHKLEGLDSDWSKPDSRRTAAYDFVPPGRYTFRVAACNNDGLWNAAGGSVAIVVQPFLWQTMWFRMYGAAALAVGLAWSVRRLERWRARLRLERLEEKHALERERARISRDIHDDLGASLTQIVFLSEQAETQPNALGQWQHRIRTAARHSLQSLDEIVWAVSPKHDTLESLANYLSQFAMEHFTLAGIQCVLEIPTVLAPLELSAEVRHNLLLAVREAVQNVVTHAAATEARVQLQLSEDALEIRVSDNGRGFLNEPAHPQGHGLRNMHRRLAQLGGQFILTSKPALGTTAEFRLPRSRLSVSPAAHHSKL